MLSALLEDERATALYLSPTKALATDQLRAVRALNLTQVRAATLRRRHALRGPRLGPPVRLARPDQPRHAAPLRAARGTPTSAASCAACATSSSTSATPTAASSARTSPRCCGGCAGSAPGTARTPVFLLASATVSEPEVSAVPAGRARRRPCQRRRLAPRHDGVRALGAPAAEGLQRRARSPGTAVGDRRDRRPAGRPGGRGRPDDRLRPVPPRRGGGRAQRPAGADGGRPRARRAGRGLPRRATCPRSAASSRGACSQATCSGWRPPTPSSWASTSRVSTPSCCPAGRGRSRRCGSRPGAPGRAGQGALAVFVARDDPLDTYLVHHPQALFGRPVETTVLDPSNPYVLGPHLCCAAAELPLTEDDLRAVRPGRRGGAARPGPPRPAAAPAQGLVLDLARAARRRPARVRRPAGAAGRGRRPAGCSGPSTTARRTARRTPVRSTCTRARPTSSSDLDLDEAVAMRAAPTTRTTARAPATSPTSGSPRPSARAAVPRCDAELRVGGRHAPGGGLPEEADRLGRGARRGAARPAGAAADDEGGLVHDDRRAAVRRSGSSGPTCPAPRTPPSTPRSACCRCSPPATAGTSAGSRPPCTRTPA